MLKKSYDDVKRWVDKLQDPAKIAGTVNFLGQSAMHMALAPGSKPVFELLLAAAPNMADKRDRWGFTPLMYAAAMGYKDSALALLRHGADISSRAIFKPANSLGDSNKQYDFIDCAFAWGHEAILWDLLHGMDEPPFLFHRITSRMWIRLAEKAGKLLGSILTKDQKAWIERFWNDILSRGPSDLNFRLSDGKNLGHIVARFRVEAAQRLIDHPGFSVINYQDDAGEHCLFTAARDHNLGAFRILAAGGADPDVRNTDGKTVLHVLLETIAGDYESEVKKVIVTFCKLRVLIDCLLKSDPSQPDEALLPSDDCDCPCSESGCLPTDVLEPVFKDTRFLEPRNLLWLVECLSMFADSGRPEWVRQSLLSLLRRSRFTELGLQHRCRCVLDRMGSAQPEDRFWDVIAEEAKIERLEAEMKGLLSMTVDDLGTALLIKMRESFRTLLVVREQAALREEEEKEKRKRMRESKRQQRSLEVRALLE